MKGCHKCGKAMISASSYDPDGTIPLVGGESEFNDDGSLKEFWVCINPACEDGRQNSNAGIPAQAVDIKGLKRCRECGTLQPRERETCWHCNSSNLEELRYNVPQKE